MPKYLAVGAASVAMGIAALGVAGMAQAEPGAPGFNLYGSPGLVDMPTAEVAPDATLSIQASRAGHISRYGLTFQITPRLSGTFRYAILKGDTFDRSFDLRYQLVREEGWKPGVVVGFQDLLGTGLYSGEYVVATKSVVPGLKLTGGLGWGRFAGKNQLGSIGTRPTGFLAQGGIPSYDKWFRGPFSAFGGVSYAINDRLTLKAEYSSDIYSREVTNSGFQRKNDWNFGIDYRFRRGTQLSLYYLYGGEVGAQLTFHTNLKSSPVPGGVETAPVPVAVRSPADIRDLGWQLDQSRPAATRTALSEALERDGLGYAGLEMNARRAVLRLRNPSYDATPQAIGRAARIMTRALPASVEEFVIVPEVNGMPTAAVTLRRSDLERLENADADALLARAQIRDGYRLGVSEPGTYQAFRWSLSPYVTAQIFDPDNPLRIDTGVRLSASYRPRSNIVFSGSLTKKLTGNLDKSTNTTVTGLPAVRTTLSRYSREGDPGIEHLTMTVYGRPGRDLYSRLSLGYLERMYAGASAELLWKPVDSRLALGVELNAVRPRDFDQRFGLRSPVTPSGTIPLLNGHLSAYYDFGNGFHGQMDAGRFLAGDLGAKLTLRREFSNGWRVGAYATFTNASADAFGEGSFDKGIEITVPLSWAQGRPTRRSNNITLQSLNRDGGARLNVRGRLYEQIRDYHRPEMEKTWGRVWR